MGVGGIIDMSGKKVGEGEGVEIATLIATEGHTVADLAIIFTLMTKKRS